MSTKPTEIATTQQLESGRENTLYDGDRRTGLLKHGSYGISLRRSNLFKDVRVVVGVNYAKWSRPSLQDLRLLLSSWGHLIAISDMGVAQYVKGITQNYVL
jgi:hypothetical protein